MSKRRRLMAMVTTWLILMVGTSAGVPAQSDDVALELDQAKGLYRDGRFDDAIMKLRSVIARLEQLSNVQNRKPQLADAYLLSGLAHIAMQRESDGLESFRHVVALDPNRRLDPDIFAPRVVKLFEQARVEAEPTAPSQAAAAPVASAPNGAAPARGAPVQPINPGTTIRLTLRANQQKVRGNLVSMSDDSFTLVDTANQQTLSFPHDMVEKIDVLHRRLGHPFLGGVIGAGMGALIGALETPGCDGNDGDCYTRGENIAYSSLGFGLVGALVGALYKTDEWIEVPVPGVVRGAAWGGKRVQVSFVITSW